VGVRREIPSMRVARETSGFAVRERRICWYCPLIYLKGGSE
jgi:hypothetical protein